MLALLSIPVWGASAARPGTLNYVEGQAAVGSRVLGAKSVGSVELAPGQSLTTRQGKAEILLTPGVLLRVGDSSAVTMVSPGLTNTEVRLDRGRAMVEVAEIYPQNNLRIDVDNTSTQLLKNGLYAFDAGQGQVRVFDGKAVVNENDRQVNLKGGRELNLFQPGAKAEKFDKNSPVDDLYQWSSLRSQYLAEANVDTARIYVAGGLGWYGAGWYWDPWFGAYTFLPGDGIFYSPFGWGFYSPFFVGGAPFGFNGNYYRHFDRDDWRVGAPVVRSGVSHARVPMGNPRPAFHGAPRPSMARPPMRAMRSFGGGFPSGGGFRGGIRGGVRH